MPRTPSNVVRLKNYRPKPERQKSMYELYPLPFFNRKKQSTRNVGRLCDRQRNCFSGEGGSVLDQQRKRRGVGVSYPACQNCGKRVRIVQRGPRSDDSGCYERQVFACGSCDHRIERYVNTDGTPRERGPPTEAALVASVWF
jgi:hypothetical protein